MQIDNLWLKNATEIWLTFLSESATWRRSDRRAASPERTASSWLTELSKLEDTKICDTTLRQPFGSRTLFHTPIPLDSCLRSRILRGPFNALAARVRRDNSAETGRILRVAARASIRHDVCTMIS